MFQNNAVREIEVDYGRKLRIYDNVFEMEYRSNLYVFAHNSYYKIGWADGSIIENKKHQFLHSFYTQEDINKIQIIEKLKTTPLVSEFDGYKLTKSVMNLSTPADVNFVHSHPEDKILLYYVNLEWRDGWHGETLFFDETGKDIVFASPYTPNRIIAFDAKIPHTIRPQSIISPAYRLTFAMIFEKC